MLGIQIVELDIPQTILALAALAGAIGVPAWVSAKRSRSAATKATAVAKETRDAFVTVLEKVSPSNGADKLADELKERFDSIDQRHAEMVGLMRTTSKTIDAVDGRVHDVSKRIDAQDRELREIRHTVENTDGRVGQVEDRLQQHLDEWDPLLGWARDASGVTDDDRKEG